MKKFLLFCYAVVTQQGFSSCSSSQPNTEYGWLKNAIDTSVQQLEETVADVGDSVLLPRSIWTGYDMDFLCRQLQRDPATFKDSLRIKPVKDATDIAVPSMIGQVVFSPETCGMRIS